METQRDTEGKDGYTKMEAQTGVMLLQAKECRQCQKPGERHGTDSAP